MTIHERSIVIEIEKVHLIRKRARTRLSTCKACGTETDIVSLTEAAALFEIDADALAGFIRENDCHFEIRDSHDIDLCVQSLLQNMERIHKTGRIAAHGG